MSRSRRTIPIVCPDSAPQALRDIEELLPQPQDWSLDGSGYMDAGSDYASYFASITAGYRAKNLTDEEARLYIYDDLGVSQRWANKFSEAGIETVADLVGHTEDELLRIEGIGTKAIEELKAGLENHGLSKVIEDDFSASADDMSQLLDMVFSPDDTVLIGGDKQLPSLTMVRTCSAKHCRRVRTSAILTSSMSCSIPFLTWASA